MLFIHFITQNKQAAVGSGSWQSCLLLLPLPTLTFGNLSPYCLLSIVYCLLSTVYCLLSTVYCLLFFKTLPTA
ncbi:MAG: hypothetical protein FVQ77_06760 [Cytophagales bacterium]|nr:hypothetical protein [Cytophagales bacterium]